MNDFDGIGTASGIHVVPDPIRSDGMPNGLVLMPGMDICAAAGRTPTASTAAQSAAVLKDFTIFIFPSGESDARDGVVGAQRNSSYTLGGGGSGPVAVELDMLAVPAGIREAAMRT